MFPFQQSNDNLKVMLMTLVSTNGLMATQLLEAYMGSYKSPNMDFNLLVTLLIVPCIPYIINYP